MAFLFVFFFFFFFFFFFPRAKAAAACPNVWYPSASWVSGQKTFKSARLISFRLIHSPSEFTRLHLLV